MLVTAFVVAKARRPFSLHQLDLICVYPCFKFSCFTGVHATVRLRLNILKEVADML